MAKNPKSPTGSQSWLGKVKGHVGEAQRHWAADERQRNAAEKAKNSTILTEQMLHSGLAGKVLHTMGTASMDECCADVRGVGCDM